MTNPQLLAELESQRDLLFHTLNSTSISELYKKEYELHRSGQVFVFEDRGDEMLADLKKMSDDKSRDPAFKAKLSEYTSLDNNAITAHLKTELMKIFDEIAGSGRSDEIQSLFIEYDYYYHHYATVVAYGLQDYPMVTQPRYINGEFDHTKEVLMLESTINMEPAWVDCSEFEDLDHIEVCSDLEKLFQLHSRTLLNKALDELDKEGKLDFLSVRPFTFYINEHGCEVMTLYRINQGSKES